MRYRLFIWQYINAQHLEKCKINIFDFYYIYYTKRPLHSPFNIKGLSELES